MNKIWCKNISFDATFAVSFSCIGINWDRDDLKDLFFNFFKKYM